MNNLVDALRSFVSLAKHRRDYLGGLSEEMAKCLAAGETALAAYDAQQAQTGLRSHGALTQPLTDEERATILAALRFYQSEGMADPDKRTEDIHDIATDGDELTSLDDSGIDDLCEKLRS